MEMIEGKRDVVKEPRVESYDTGCQDRAEPHERGRGI